MLKLLGTKGKRFSTKVLAVFLSALVAGSGLLVVSPSATRNVQAAGQMVVESLDGPVTQNEINAFKNYMSDYALPTTNEGNLCVYGTSGEAVEALGIVYEISKDTQILNRMIDFADRMLAIRNDPVTGRIVWTGNRELCWPNKAVDATDALYSGSENGDVIAHIAYCAKLILQNSTLWNNIVPNDPYGYGATYLQRAQKYVTELDKTMDTFMIPYFVQSGSNQFRWPDDDRFAAIPGSYAGNRGNPIPWNQQFMIQGGFLRLAECHELLGDNPSRVATYDAIVKTSVDWFTSQLYPYQVNGHDVYKWTYPVDNFNFSFVEDVNGVHGAYDVMGMNRAYNRGKYGVTQSTMKRMADTFQYVIAIGDGTFHSKVDGTGTILDRVWSEWLNLAPFNTADYNLIANARFMASVPTSPSYCARVLWVKNLLSSPTPTPTPTLPPASANLAQGKTATASSSWSSSYDASKAVDANDTTRWSAASGQTANQWLAIDLGSGTTCDKVILKEITFQRVTSYKLQYSDDGSNYTDITGTAGTSIGASKTITFSPVTAKYIRLYVSTASNVPTVNEVEVYYTGTPTPSPAPTPTPTPTPTPNTTNLALNKTATASSTWSGSLVTIPAYAVDGDSTTRWSAASGQTSNQWLAVDLGTGTSYSKAVIKEITYQRVTSYKLQYSNDGTNYTDIAGTSGTSIGASKTITFSPVTVRYIRLYVTTASDVPTINEFEVY